MLKFILLLFIALISYNTIANQNTICNNYGSSVSSFNAETTSTTTSENQKYFICG